MYNFSWLFTNETILHLCIDNVCHPCHVHFILCELNNMVFLTSNSVGSIIENSVHFLFTHSNVSEKEIRNFQNKWTKIQNVSFQLTNEVSSHLFYHRWWVRLSYGPRKNDDVCDKIVGTIELVCHVISSGNRHECSMLV